MLTLLAIVIILQLIQLCFILALTKEIAKERGYQEEYLREIHRQLLHVALEVKAKITIGEK